MRTGRCISIFVLAAVGLSLILAAPTLAAGAPTTQPVSHPAIPQPIHRGPTTQPVARSSTTQPVGLTPIGHPLARRPASQPEKLSQPDDPWSVEILADELERCTGPEDYAALAERTRKVILAVLAFGEADELKTLSLLLAIQRACSYLPQADRLSGDDKLGKWLLKNWQVTRLLLRAMGDRGGDEYEIPTAITRLNDLVTADRAAVAAYPDLAVAFCVVHPDDKNSRGKDDNSTMVDAFRYYTRAKVNFRFDPKKMPWELACYLADSRLPTNQRLWAANRYANSAIPAKSYGDVPYDDVALEQGKPLRISGFPYTLANLQQKGGVCVDQAYYASEVCKALGIPAAPVTGQSRSGALHAWVAYLRNDGHGAWWDSSVGRYEDDKFVRGQVRDPQSAKVITDSELMLTGLAAAQLDLRRREEADVAVALAHLILNGSAKATKPDPAAPAAPAKPDPPARASLDKPDAADLIKLAALYNERFKDKRPAVRLDETMKPNRAVDLDLAESLLVLSLERDCAFRAAWDMILSLFTKGDIPVGHLDRFFNILISRTVRQFPDYSFDLLAQVLPIMPDSAAQVRACDKLIGLFPNRHDLQGKLLVIAGDGLRDLGRRDDAIRCYRRSAELDLEMADNVLTAADRAEKVMLEARRADLAVRMYQDLYSRVPTSLGVALKFREPTLSYQLGLRLVRLLKWVGKNRDADQISRQINSPS